MTRHVKGVFDPVALHAALDRRREEMGISWREVARQNGLSSNNLSAWLRQGRSINAEYLCRLMAWLGTDDIGPFVSRDPT